MSYIVAIVGRPNVGKSTLYNRLIGERLAIIDDESGVTRDRIYGESVWNGKEITVVDTGGFVRDSHDVFEAAIRDQVQIAIEEADVILFMTDVTTGITYLDDHIADLLRKSNKPVVVCVNKVDNHSRQLSANEFWGLGFDNTFFVSSISGSGTGDLLDAVVDLLPEREVKEEESELPRIAVVGQPNVGKSSFVNALLGEQRNIVTDIAGTTRDAIDTRYTKYGHDFILVDTAGIRKKSKVHENLEFYSVIRAIKAIEEADICLLMIDAQTGVEAQDMKIFSLIQKKRKGLVIMVNKWDLIEDKETNSARDYEKNVKERISPFNDVPVLFASALEKQRIFKAVELLMKVHENRRQKIKTSVLNEVMQEAMQRYPPPAHRGRLIKIKYVTQLPTYFPSFAFFCNHPKHIKEAYRNYLENQLRESFDLTGVPINVHFREK
ncbi:MAG: ribosome biogenesis GTPase Der [Saprospiraceae bacterium]